MSKTAKKPGRKGGNPAWSGPRFRRRRKKIPPPPGQIPDDQLIEQHLAKHGVTKCKSMHAPGSLKMTMLGFDG